MSERVHSQCVFFECHFAKVATGLSLPCFCCLAPGYPGLDNDDGDGDDKGLVVEIVCALH